MILIYVLKVLRVTILVTTSTTLYAITIYIYSLQIANVYA